MHSFRLIVAITALALLAACTSDAPPADAPDSAAGGDEAQVGRQPEGSRILPSEQWPDDAERPPDVDPDEWEHLRMFPTDAPAPEPTWTDDPDAEHPAHDEVPQPDIADPDDPYPILPPDLDDVDPSDPQSVAAAWGCHWFVADEDQSAAEAVAPLLELSTDELADELETLGGITEPGEWYEAELVAVGDLDDADAIEVTCHTRTFFDDEFMTVAYDRPVVLTMHEDDDGWKVADFDTPDYASWHPTEIPPGH